MELFQCESSREHTFSWLGAYRVLGAETLWFLEMFESGEMKVFESQDEFNAFCNHVLASLKVRYDRSEPVPAQYLEELQAKSGELLVFKIDSSNNFNEDMEVPFMVPAIFDYTLADGEFVVAKVSF